MSKANALQMSATAAVIATFASMTVADDSARAEEMTAGVVLEKMPGRERSAYIMGIVEGLAYGRFRADTKVAGSKDQRGMNCIYGWFYKDAQASYDTVEAAFAKYSDFTPSAVLNALIKKECGE